MEQLKRDYRRLKDQLVNVGEETCHDEVMWNDGVLIALDELFENSPGEPLVDRRF
jgi:hypothetical protein